MTKSLAMTTFSKNLTRIIEDNGWTIQELADRCKMRRSNISRLIHGHHSPTLEVAEQIAKACSIELYELLDPNLEKISI